MSSLVAFVGAAFLIAMVPGPSTAVILRRSVMHGRVNGMATVLGHECGVLLWGLAAAFGLSALLLASRLAYDAMRITGAVVLVYMGARALWKARAKDEADDEPAPAAAVSPSCRGIITKAARPRERSCW